MGCWEETCAVTRTPIFAGDPVVMILFKDQRQFKYRFQWFLENDGDAHTQVEALYFGTYNDYGWINEVEDPTYDKHERAAFVHRWAWDRVQEMIPDDHKAVVRAVKLCDSYFMLYRAGGDSEEEVQERIQEIPYEFRPIISADEERMLTKLVVYTRELRIDVANAMMFSGHQCNADEFARAFRTHLEILTDALQRLEEKANGDTTP